MPTATTVETTRSIASGIRFPATAIISCNGWMKMSSNVFTPEEMMTIAAARTFRDGATCFVGVGLPSVAACLARELHAPNITLVYESGAIGSKPTRPPLSIADPELAETACTEERVTHNQQRPPITQGLERLGNPAVHVVKTFASHKAV